MKKIIFLTIVLCVLSCKKLVDWDKFQLQKTEYTGSQLRTNGYYYKSLSNGTYGRLYCFYKNGVLLNMGNSFTSMSEMEDYINRVFISNNSFDNSRSNWGLFVITNQTIQFEHYYPSSDFEKKSYVSEGEILSDTSFHIKVSYRSDGSEGRDEDELYYFKRFSPKPDSTNVFF